MTISELLEQIKDDRLKKEQLESYYSKICELRSQLSVSIADLVKKEAIFLSKRGEESVASAKINWKSSEDGQKLITYKGYATALASAERGIKNRIFSLIN